MPSVCLGKEEKTTYIYQTLPVFVPLSTIAPNINQDYYSNIEN